MFEWTMMGKLQSGQNRSRKLKISLIAVRLALQLGLLDCDPSKSDASKSASVIGSEV